MSRLSTCPGALVVLLIPSHILAIPDDTPDSFGIHFDTDGDVMYTTVAPVMPFDAYLTLANPVGQVAGTPRTAVARLILVR